jgi:sugar lactone lactonase YvrE
MDRKFLVGSLFAVFLTVLLLLPSVAASQSYRFERMWPTLQQPWYFVGPTYIALDKHGYVFVSDTWNHRIQKFSPDGVFITKWGGLGTGDGQFISPHGVAVDSSGFLYVADEGNHRIQKFSPDGTFITKWGGYGTGDGNFKCPASIAVDNEGFVYVTDYGNHRIEKFSPDGVFITKWGSPGSGDGEFDSPFGVAVDRGFIYVTDYGNHRIQKFGPDGEFITKWGGIGRGNGNFMHPFGIAVNNEIVYAADYGNDRIQKFSTNGAFITKWGSIGNEDGEFYNPYGIAIDGNDFIYVTDDGNHRIQKFSYDGVFITKWGANGTGNGDFQCPASIAVDGSGFVYVTDYGNHRVQKFSPDGEFIAKWGAYGTGDGKFINPYGIAVDGSGYVYVADTGNHRIQKFDSGGTFITKWGTQGTGDGEFDNPWGMAVDDGSFLYVADTGNHRIQKFDSGGTFITKWGAQGTGVGEFDKPWGIASDNNGFVYVADGGNRRIQKFSGNGQFVTEWGNDIGEIDRFSSPSSLAVASDGRIFVSDVNDNRVLVFREVTLSSSNKAIIVAAGGPFEGNHLWDATQMSANFAYQALTYQGFTKDSIYYMTSDTDLDIDNNGVLDDIDSDVTLAGLRDAITAWAADADNLVLYIVDHGGNGTVRMNGSEILAASDLDSWLDTVQAAMPGRVLVVYDACESGSFLAALSPPAGKERIIISSTSAGESAYFVNQGSVSFSYFFWTSIFNGNNIKDAFNTAKSALGQAISGQTPLLDDNGNGIGSEPADGALAQSTYIGNGTTIQGNVPSIESVSPDQTVNGTASAALSAYNVTDNDGIARVWAVIIPPGFTPGSSNNAVQGLPYLDLLPAGGDVYEATYDQFNIEGTYQISIYARDRIGNTSIPKRTTVSVGNPLRRKAVIVAGGDQTDDNWNATEKGALSAYNALTFQGYTDQDIYFLSPVTFTSGVDGLPVISNLSYAINTWAADSTWDVVIYMIGNGDEGTYRINNTETLSAADLDAWLDNLQNAISGKATVIYDAGRAGSFLPLLTPPAGRERIVLASTERDEPVYFLSDGDISFSRFFWSRILNGLNVRDAWLNARQAMSFTSGQKQTALLDDNGNGIGNETGDGILSRDYTIGAGIQLAGNDPLIGSVVPDQVLQGQTSSTLWADSVTSTGTIDKVWAVIIPPGYVSGRPDQSMMALPELMLDSAGINRYEGTYNDFSIFGVYHITIYAMDIDNNISTVKETAVQQTDGPDMYEDDDSYNQANVIVLNAPDPQQHNFHNAGDEDWVKFYGLAGKTYEIRASYPGADNDAVLELYDTDGTTLLAEVNNPGSGVQEILNWTFSLDGIYYVKVKHSDPSVSGQGTEYDLEVYIPTMPPVFGLLAGIVYDSSSGARLSNVPVRTSYGLSDISRPDGTYIIYHPSGTYTVTASKTGYYPYQSSFKIVGSETVTKNIPMTASCTDIDGDGYGNPGSSGCANGSAQDCNDGNSSINPGASEVCDSVDNDCDGLVDDNDPNVAAQSTWHPDNDSDGYGNGSISLQQCSQQPGYVPDNTDCDDNDENIYPGGPPVRIANTPPDYYSMLQDAYNNAGEGDIIQSKAVSYTQDISFDIEKSVSIEGGFDCSFSVPAGHTVINGNVMNNSGSVTLENFSLE